MSIERRAFSLALAGLCFSGGRTSLAQQSAKTPRDSTLATGITAGEADAEPRRRTLVKALNLNLGFTTLRMRLEFAQGTGRLTRFGVTGTTLVFQSRIQLLL